MRIFTVNKILFFIVFCTIALVWAIVHNAKPLTVKILNNILADNHIEVLNFDAEYISFNHISIPRLILKIEDSHIAIQDFNLELRDSLQVLKNQQINADDIISIHTESVYVDLGDSFFIRQSQQTEESPAALQLNLGQLPMIDLGAITIKLPVLNKKDKQQQTLKMDKLTLAQNGELETVWRFNDFSLFSLNASLDKRAWTFNTFVDLGLSYQGLKSLNQYLNLLHDKQNPQAGKTDNMLDGLRKQLSQLLQPIDDQQITIDGQWTTKSRIDLISGEMSSQQSIADLSLYSPRWPSLYFAPQQPVNAMINLGHFPVTASLNDSKATKAFAVKINIAPLNYQLSPSVDDRNKLITLFAGAQKDTIVNILEKLTPKSTSQLTNIDISMDYPIEVVIPLQNDDLPLQVLLPDVKVSIEGLLLHSKLKLTHTTFNSQQQFSSHFDWENTLSAQQATDNTIIGSKDNASLSISATTPMAFDIKGLFPTLPVEQLSLSKAKLHLTGKISKQKQQLELTFQPNSSLAVHNTSILRRITSTNEQEAKQTENTSARLGAFNVILDDTSTITYSSNNTQVMLSPFTTSISQLVAQQTDQAAISKLSTTQASLNKADVSINQALSFTINHHDAIEKSIARWLQSSTTNSINWHINKLDITKQLGKSRHQPLFALNNINVTQQLNLSKGLLVGNEQWQLDTLKLTSYHLLKFADNESPLSLAGQWNFDSDIETALQTLNKVQPLPSNFTIQGHSKLLASFALSEINNTNQFEMKIQQQLSSLSGKWEDKSFNGGDVFAQCQFNWQQIHDAKNAAANEKQFAHSQLVCPQTAISLAQAKLGLSLTHLNLNANIELNKDGNKAPSNWLQQITGLSETNISLTASGDMLDGHFLLPEFVLKLHDKSYGYLLLQGLSLEKFLEEQPQVGVKANGLFDGVLPAELIDGKVTIAGGKLAARSPGGLIEVAGNPAIDRLELTQPYLELVFTALEHLKYSELSSTFDMTPNGDAVIKIGVKGNSRDVERPVHLNYTHQENLIQLYKSTQIGNQLQNKIETKIQ
ncbi:YdbH domain-containing protein [Shewanella sp. A14]